MSDREHDLKKPLSCRDFRERIFDFQADELSETNRESFTDHRDACPPCARRLEVEDGLLRGLRERLRPEPAPPELKGRVRAALRREAPGPESRAWSRPMAWALPLAASLLLALMLGPLLGRRVPVDTPGVVPFEERVTVIDFDCDSAGKSLEQQVGCLDPRHLNAVKTDDGRVWQLSLDRPRARRLVVNRDMRGHVLQMTGSLYTAIETVKVDEYDDLGPVRKVAASVFPPHL